MDRLITDLLTKFLAPLLNQTGTGWKTLTGLILLLMSWVFRTWIAPKYFPQYSELAGTFETLALTLTGIGVYHKAQNMPPPSVTPVIEIFPEKIK